MALDALDTSFESLRGTMLTNAGADGLQEFTTDLPDYLVVDEAFTPEAADTIQAVGEQFSETPSDYDAVAGLVRCLGSVSRHGIARHLYTDSTWQSAALSMPPHVDFKHGHTLIGSFNVVGSPTFQFFTERTSELQPWVGSTTELTAWVPIEKSKPVLQPLRSLQLIVVNGAAIQGEIELNRHRGRGLASLPHGVIVGDGDSRSRMMTFGNVNRSSRKLLPGSD